MGKSTSLFIKNMQNLPMWVKQVLATELSEDLNKKLADFKDLVQGDNLFQYLVPKTTIKGKQELESRSMNLSEGYYTLLEDAQEGKNNVFDITVKNNWALSDCAKIFVRLYELELILTPAQNQETCFAIALFIASKIKTGEFLKKIKKIDAIQLEQALRYQKQLNEEGRHIKMASILIKMGFITDIGLDSLLMLKEEAKRRLQSVAGIISAESDNEEENNSQIAKLQKEITRLENENLIMKKHLKKLLHMD